MKDVVYGPNTTPWWASYLPWVGVTLFVVMAVAIGYAYWKFVIKK